MSHAQELIIPQWVESDPGRIRPHLDRLQRTGRVVCSLGFRDGLSLVSDRIRYKGKSEFPRFVWPLDLMRPVTLTASASDFCTYQEVMIQHLYHLRPDLSAAIDGLPVVDIGANIGLTSAYFASHHPHSGVLAIEPNPGNYDYLVANAVAYGDRIRPLRRALNTNNGQVAMANEEILGTGKNAIYQYLQLSSENNLKGQSATAITPQDIIKIIGEGQPIGLLKVDIEGAETALFESGSIDPLLKACRALIIETHDQFVPGSSRAVLQAAGRNHLSAYDQKRCVLYFENLDTN